LYFIIFYCLNCETYLRSPEADQSCISILSGASAGLNKLVRRRKAELYLYNAHCGKVCGQKKPTQNLAFLQSVYPIVGKKVAIISCELALEIGEKHNNVFVNF
jgi:non-ribosomal peptide synthetase component E (peptide arylation enzyme)